MRSKTVRIEPTDADRDGICASQNPSAAGNLTIAGALATAGIATLTPPCHVSIYGAGNESAFSFTVTGTDRNNAVLVETITGANAGTAKGSKNFKTVTQVYVNGNSGAIEVGSTDELESGWVPVEYRGRTVVSIRESTGTELFATAIDRTFTGGSTNWANGPGGNAMASFDETTDLSLTANALGDYAVITFVNIGTNLTSGKTYRLLYDYSETVAGFEFQLVGAATQTIGDVVAGSQNGITFIASEDFTASDELRIVAKTSAIAEGDFDNFSLFEPPESLDMSYVVQHTMSDPWKSFNEHDANPIDGMPSYPVRAVRAKIFAFVAGRLDVDIISNVVS